MYKINDFVRKIFYCNCCGKQIIVNSSIENNPYTTSGIGAVRDVNGFICGKCAVDLNENSCFPEEVSYSPTSNLLKERENVL